MHDNTENLVKMANQIATSFRLKPAEQALASTVTHIKKFWDPRMKAKMAEHLAHGGEGLTPLAREALALACKAKASAGTGH